MRWAWLCLALMACPRADEIVFASAEGSGRGLGECLCSYDDNSHGNGAVQVTCTRGNSTFASIGFFFSPPYGGDVIQGFSFLFQAPDHADEYPGGGLGRVSAPGDAGTVGYRIIRPLGHIELKWPRQRVCSVIDCSDPYEFEEGSLSSGSGGCDDFWANVGE